MALSSPDARRTLAEYRKDVLHSIGNPESSELDIDVDQIINDALEQLVAMHEWRWLTVGQATLDITADQDYVELPSDFGTLKWIEHDEGFTRVMIPVPWRELIRLRQDSVQNYSRSFWYTINTGNVELGDEDAGLSLSTIELYPTPASDALDGLNIVYNRNIRRLKDATDRPQWPANMDRLLSLLARAMASTDFDDEVSSAYMAEFNLLFESQKVKDGLSVASFGLQRGGLWPRTTPISPFYPKQIPDPVLRSG